MQEKHRVANVSFIKKSNRSSNEVLSTLPFKCSTHIHTHTFSRWRTFTGSNYSISWQTCQSDSVLHKASDSPFLVWFKFLLTLITDTLFTQINCLTEPDFIPCRYLSKVCVGVFIFKATLLEMTFKPHNWCRKFTRKFTQISREMLTHMLTAHKTLMCSAD